MRFLFGMKINYFFQHGLFILYHHHYTKIRSYFRKKWLCILGAQIGAGTILKKTYVTWPHQIYLGKDCILEHDISFKFDDAWQPGPNIQIMDRVFVGSGCEFNIRHGIKIGSDSLIASGCRFVDHDHGISLGSPIGAQPGPGGSIELGYDVWLGCNVIVLKGVIIGDGAVVAAGAVVTKSILPNEIWAGMPAKKIGQRH